MFNIYILSMIRQVGAVIKKKIPRKQKSINRIVVIGDLHGDWRATIRALKTANLVGITDEKNDRGKLIWKGGSTVVVQMGDQVDRKNRDNSNNDEASEERIIRLFDYLHRQALKEGGGVYSLLGNHELMNVEGDFSYASPDGIKYFNKYEKSKPNNLWFNTLSSSILLFLFIFSFKRKIVSL